MKNCNLCPRNCGADRENTRGFCKVPSNILAARAGLHFWEEPCISGLGGSGTIFFSGCNLGCVYCQNSEISRGQKGKEVTVSRLREIFEELIDAGAENINLVTPTHYADVIAKALNEYKPPIPVVYNTGSYEKAETLRMLDGLVDIYLPDYKYAHSDLAANFSFAPDYPEIARNAILEMFRQRGKYRFNEDDMLESGVLIRHLVLPEHTDNTLDVIDFITDTFSEDDVLFSIMSQYTPPKNELPYPELNRRVTEAEYEKVADYLYLLGVENCYLQELSSSQAEYTPDFDLSGI